jgi:hypothetical protein
MSDTYSKDGSVERLVESHIELCKRFDRPGTPGPREVPLLETWSGEKNTAECLADLVDRALAAYEGRRTSSDPRISSLKLALIEAISELARAGGRGS